MNDTPEKENEELREKTGLQLPEEVLPPEPRKRVRPPHGGQGPARRVRAPAAATRRKLRTNVGRERYLDMVLRERALFAQQGHTRSAEQLLSSAGAGAETEASDGEQRESATARPAALHAARAVLDAAQHPPRRP